MAFSRTSSGKVTWYATFVVPGGRRKEERAVDGGYPNSQAGAKALERKRKDQVANGTYGTVLDQRPTVEQYAAHWTKTRDRRNKKRDYKQLQRHILGRHVNGMRFGAMHVDAPTPKVIRAMVLEIRSEAKLSPKSQDNLYRILHSMYRSAVADEHCAYNPCAIVGGDLPRIVKSPQRIYSQVETEAILGCDALDDIVWMMFVVMTFCGERVGEALGHRWSDWDDNAKPLGSMLLERQYKGAPLKTERDRVIPVHDELAKALRWWRSRWSAVYGREPNGSDPIVANPIGPKHFIYSRAYKRATEAFAACGLPWKANHAMRRTFITMLRRNSERKDLVERVTHNAQGSIVDRYTVWEWRPLCDVVSKLPFRISVPRSGHGAVSGSGIPEAGPNVGGVGAHPAGAFREAQITANNQKIAERPGIAEIPGDLSGRETHGALRGIALVADDSAWLLSLVANDVLREAA